MNSTNKTNIPGQVFSQQEILFENSKILSLLADDREYAFQLICDQHCDSIFKVAMR